MNCQEFWETGGETLDHLQECPACAARHERQERLAQRLHVLGAEKRHVGAPARVERRLVAAYRGQAAFSGVRRNFSWFPMVAWGTALAATAVAGLLLVHPRQPHPAHRMVRNPVALAMVETPETLDAIANLADADGEFIRLPNAETLAPNEQIDVIRVAVPRSAMIPLGYTVSEEHASETVEADVVLGSDGQARAVRFVEGTDY